MDAENNMQYLYGSTAVLGDKDIAICGTHGWVCPGDIHYQEDRDAKPYRRELLRVERTLQEAEALQCKHTILLLHYPPVCDLTKPSGFTDLLENTMSRSVSSATSMACSLEPCSRAATTGRCSSSSQRTTGTASS